MGSKAIHVADDPEVERACETIRGLNAFYTDLEKALDRQLNALKLLNHAEGELSLFYNQKGYQENRQEGLGSMFLQLGEQYRDVRIKERQVLIAGLETFIGDVKTFRTKAIADSLESMKKQINARIELDSFATKYNDLLLKVNKGPDATNSSTDILSLTGTEPIDVNGVQPSLLKQLESARSQFVSVKAKYEKLSKTIIDKAMMLQTKRDTDLRDQMRKFVLAHHKVVDFANGPATQSANSTAMFR
ncbi:hypothetical protein HK102_013435 [Quaeritorhiza haematococci]|nr:hypothetical protein HK102_013435 [Quaeritorhiza haematococci]